MSDVEMPKATSAVDLIQKINTDVRYRWLLINCYTYHCGKDPKSVEQAQRWLQELLKEYTKCSPVVNYVNERISRIFTKGIGVKDPYTLRSHPTSRSLNLLYEKCHVNRRLT